MIGRRLGAHGPQLLQGMPPAHPGAEQALGAVLVHQKRVVPPSPPLPCRTLQLHLRLLQPHLWRDEHQLGGTSIRAWGVALPWVANLPLWMPRLLGRRTMPRAQGKTMALPHMSLLNPLSQSLGEGMALCKPDLPKIRSSTLPTAPSLGLV